MVVMNVAIFWNIAPCSPYVNRRFEGKYRLNLRVENQHAAGGLVKFSS
jgi:hypothetical protein